MGITTDLRTGIKGCQDEFKIRKLQKIKKLKIHRKTGEMKEQLGKCINKRCNISETN
jgi:hypothetical protein